MPGNRFVDTNVLLYLYSEDEPDKKAVASGLFGGTDRVWISTQVLSEAANVLGRKFGLPHRDIANVIAEACAACNVHVVTKNTIALALRLGERHGHSFFDSQIIAAALECGCDSLLSEDMHDGLLVESRLTIRNPFA